MDIESSLIKYNDSALPNSFVSLAVKVIDDIPTHAAILIRHNDKDYLHHFPGADPPEVIEDFDKNGWFIYKIWDLIKVDDPDEVGSFLQYCRRVCAFSKITYSFISDGSKHDFMGEFESKSGLPELGTCVSFCVNTLTNFLIDSVSYFHLEDWDDSELIEAYDKWAIKQVEQKYPDLDWTKYNAFKKRIKPIEFLCSSFFSDKYPIRKEQVNSIEAQVINLINSKSVKESEGTTEAK